MDDSILVLPVFDAEIVVGAELNFNILELHPGFRQDHRAAPRADDEGYFLDVEALTHNIERAINQETRDVTITGVQPGEFLLFYRDLTLFDDDYYRIRRTQAFRSYPPQLVVRGHVAHSPSYLLSHVDDPVLRRRPIGLGHLRVDGRLYNVPMKSQVELAGSDGGAADCTVWSPVYIRPGATVVTEDDHEGLVATVEPIYELATAQRAGSILGLENIEPREAPASACIDAPPTHLEPGARHQFSICHFEPNHTYRWEATDDGGNYLDGVWDNQTSRTPVLTVPKHGVTAITVTLTTTDDEGHIHVNAARIGVHSPNLALVALLQDRQDGDPDNRYRFLVRIPFAGFVLRIHGKGKVRFESETGVPLVDDVAGLEAGDWTFFAVTDSPGDADGALVATLEGVSRTTTTFSLVR